MNILVFLIIVSTGSAWYVPDEQFNTHDKNLIQRRNDENINQKLETTLWGTERTSVSSSELGSLEDIIASSVWETERTNVQTTELGSLEDRVDSWVWGTEELSVTTTKPESFTDKAAASVWGTEETGEKTTELYSLLSRAAFTANGCSTGTFRIGGICAVRD